VLFADPLQLQRSANGDAEFRRAARYWNATLSLETSTQALCIEIVDGQIVNCQAGQPGVAATLTVAATEDGWERFLAPIPAPFYQDLLGGCVQHHDFTVAGDMLTLSAYYQASQRLFAIMRALRSMGQEESHGTL
jgi:hypothetical protein